MDWCLVPKVASSSLSQVLLNHLPEHSGIHQEFRHHIYVQGFQEKMFVFFIHSTAFIFDCKHQSLHLNFNCLGGSEALFVQREVWQRAGHLTSLKQYLEQDNVRSHRPNTVHCPTTVDIFYYYYYYYYYYYLSSLLLLSGS